MTGHDFAPFWNDFPEIIKELREGSWIQERKTVRWAGATSPPLPSLSLLSSVAVNSALRWSCTLFEGHNTEFLSETIAYDLSRIDEGSLNFMRTVWKILGNSPFAFNLSSSTITRVNSFHYLSFIFFCFGLLSKVHMASWGCLLELAHVKQEQHDYIAVCQGQSLSSRRLCKKCRNSHNHSDVIKMSVGDRAKENK